MATALLGAMDPEILTATGVPWYLNRTIPSENGLLGKRHECFIKSLGCDGIVCCSRYSGVAQTTQVKVASRRLLRDEFFGRVLRIKTSAL